MESSAAAAAPPRSTKKLNTEKGRTSKRNEIAFLPPTGDTPRRSPRLIKSKPIETPKNEPAKNRGKKSSSRKEGKRKDSDDEETEAPDEEKSATATATARVAGETQRSDVEMKKAEDGREMNEEVANGEALPGGESGSNIEAGLNDENEEKITKNTGKTKCLESGNKMDSITKEEEMNTVEKQTAAKNQEKVEQIVLGELRAPPGWTKEVTSTEVPSDCLFGICSTVCKAMYDLKDMLNPGKDPTSKRNEIVFISPTGEKMKDKRQLNQFLKSNPGGPASSEFYWGTGDTPRRSPRISKSKSLETLEKEPAKKLRRNSSSSKEGNRKNNDNEETEASDERKIATAAAKVAEGTQARSDGK